LYVYRGEDFPKDDTNPIEKTEKKIAPKNTPAKSSPSG
jgi:hypothetical protein